MNSPIQLLNNYFPYEIKILIQSYLINEMAYKMLQEYFLYLYLKKNYTKILVILNIYILTVIVKHIIIPDYKDGKQEIVIFVMN
jgi:hypothetical protein